MKYPSLVELLARVSHSEIQAIEIDFKNTIRFELKNDETGVILFEDDKDSVLRAFLDYSDISWTRF